MIGTVLCRLVVPGWILLGATLKLIDRTPSLLPFAFKEYLKQNPSIDDMVFLRVLIGLELFAIGVMLFVPRLARVMAIFMLSVFCLVLLNEIRLGQDKCGCMGSSVSLSPWVMLAIDGTMLLGVLLFRPGRRNDEGNLQPRRSLAIPIVMALVILGVGLGIAFAVPGKAEIEQTVIQTGNGDNNGTSTATNGGGEQVPVPIDPTINPAPRALPSHYYPRDAQSFVGKDWRDIDVFQLMPRWPKDMDGPRKHVIFYSRTCEHCKAMFETDLSQPLKHPVAVVRIPNDGKTMNSPNDWPMPPAAAAQVEMLDLPLGPSWLFTAPMIITVENGKVICVEESDHKKCFNEP